MPRIPDETNPVHCDRPMRKHKKLADGTQQYICPECRETYPKAPMGRPRAAQPKSDAERAKAYRQRKKEREQQPPTEQP